MTDESNRPQRTPTAQRLQVLRNGYTPLPNVDKLCVLRGWPTVDVTEETIQSWARIRGWEATGIRLENGLCVIDLDVDHADFDALALDLIARLPVLDEALFRAGSGKKEAWYVRTDEPFSRIATALFIDPEGDPEEGFRVEVFGGGSARQFGSLGWHTKGEKSYRWSLDDYGDDDDDDKDFAGVEVSPLNVPLADLPLLTKQDVFDIVQAASDWLAARFELKLADGGETDPHDVYDLTEGMTFDMLHGENLSLAELRAVGEGNCAASFIDGPVAQNRRRCLVSTNPEGALTVWDSMTGTTHREASAAPIDREAVRRAMAERLVELGGTLPAPEAEATDTAWRMHYVLTDEGTVRQTEANMAIWLNLDDWEGVFSVSDFDHNLYVMRPMPGHRDTRHPRRLTDSDIIHVQIEMQHDIFPSVPGAKVKTAIIKAAEDNPHNAPRDYLEGVIWDGKERLSDAPWALLGCEPDASMISYYQKAFRKWMISAVARIMEPGCKADHMLVLQGRQGSGKSTFLSILGGQWFGDDMPPVGLKDAKEWIRDQWIAEIAELGAISGRDIEHVKAFLTTRVDKFRKSYGAVVEVVPRQVVFAGSTNDDEYLLDPTGGRRFWPLKTGKIDAALLRANRDQIWAEAVAAYQAGEVWHLDAKADADAIMGALDAQEGARSKYPEEEPIRKWLRTHKAEEGLLSYDVAVGALQAEAGHVQPVLQHRIPRILGMMGWEKSHRTKKGAVWVRGPEAEPYLVRDPTTGTAAERAAKKAAAMDLTVHEKEPE